MKRNLLLLAVMVVAALLFTANSWAQDLGKPDSLIVKTFACDHTYEATAGYDSVRVCLWVSHDSNTFYWTGGAKWVQDSINAMVIPLTFWHQPAGHADSVVLPNWDVGTGVLYNNTEISIDDPNPLPYSVFRDISCEGTPYANRIKTLKWDTRILDIESHSCDTDSGHAWFSLIAGGTRKKWYQGSEVLLATLTFWVYMNPAYDTTEIGLDTMSAPPAWNLTFTRYDAVGYAPVVNLPVKDTIYIVPCLPPDITCPDNESQHTNNTFTTTTKFNATAGGTAGILLTGVTAATAAPGLSPTVTVNYDSPPPAATLSGTITYTVTNHCLAGGAITLTATNGCPLSAQCSFNVTLSNGAPSFTTCPGNVEREWDKSFKSSDFVTSDPDGDNVTVTIGSVIPTPTNLPTIVGSHVEWIPTVADTCIFYAITLVATDICGATNTAPCTFTFHAIPEQPTPAGVRIDCPVANPGELVKVPILIDRLENVTTIGGFEFEVEFDYVNLCFIGAERGDLINTKDQETGLLDWEYFTYRLLPCNAPPCQKYKILIYGQYDLPNNHVGVPVHVDPGLTDDLVILKFQVAYNELLRGFCIPIKFEFEPYPLPRCEEPGMNVDWDCAENTMSDSSGNFLFVSDDILKFQSNCCHQPVYDYVGVPFVDGCVCIPEMGPAVCKRGDVNFNHLPYETGDAVLFARYFVFGLTVFTFDQAYQICATDVNADGRTLMLADLIYLIRVIQRDAVPFPKLGPSSDVANVIVSDGRITVECASAIGGILFKFDGAVTPTLLNTNMELLSNEGNVLVWSSDGHSINAGASQLLTASGAELVSVIAVDREGRDLATTITTKLAPTTFALHPAYPNPFNPNTNLSFTLPTAVSYSLNIYNVAGQLVRSYQGMGNVGLNVIIWDGKDNAGNDASSGVYFYKLIAGSFTATNKMIMLK